MYSRKTGLILGFHGCDKSIVENILTGKEKLKGSKNNYDWLGNGIYFWEHSPSRALEYATSIKNNPSRSKTKIKDPAIIGAVIDLGYCLDLLDFQNLTLLKTAYDILVQTFKKSGIKIPQNRPPKHSTDLLIRELDCAVIETLHKVQAEKNIYPFDSIRGVFWEGEELYSGAGFREKDHIQICIRNPNCIKGFFFPRKIDNNYSNV